MTSGNQNSLLIHAAPLMAGNKDGVPNGVRTRVATLKEWRPRPLVDGDTLFYLLCAQQDLNLRLPA